MPPCEPELLVNETHQCAIDTFTGPISEPQLGLFITVMVVVPLYVKYEDPVVPAVALALTAGILFPLLPGTMKGIAWVVMFAALTVGVFAAVYRTMLT